LVAGDTEENPFDESRNYAIGLDNLRPKTPRQKERERLLREIEKEKDPEITAELKKGNIVTVVWNAVNH
jgi:hypothetical protein